MSKRKWTLVLAVVAAVTLLVAGTAYAAQGGKGPQSRTGSTITPSTTCSTCTPSTLGGTGAPVTTCSTCTPSTTCSTPGATRAGDADRERARTQERACDGTCTGDPTEQQVQTQERLRDGTGDGGANRYGNGGTQGNRFGR